MRDIKVKAISNSNTKINCISKNLVDKISLAIRQEISILLIEITKAHICFEKIIKDVKKFVKNVVIYTLIFIVF